MGPVIAGDASERAIALCSARAKAAGRTSIATMKMDIFQTPFSDQTFENIFCCDLLGHLPDPGHALTELRRVVSAGGTAVVTLFTEKDSARLDDRMIRNEDGSYWFREKWFFRFYGEAEARELCHRSGFDVASVEELSWWEGPHEGYREYRHEHSSWALALRRK